MPVSSLHLVYMLCMKDWSSKYGGIGHSELIKFPSDGTIRPKKVWKAKKCPGSNLSIHVHQRHVSLPARNDLDVSHVFAGK